MIQMYHFFADPKNLFYVCEAAGNQRHKCSLLEFNLGACVEIYLTVREVAAIVRLSVPTIRRYTMNKEIPFHKIKRAVRFKKTEIEKWVEQREAGLFADANSLGTGRKA